MNKLIEAGDFKVVTISKIVCATNRRLGENKSNKEDNQKHYGAYYYQGEFSEVFDVSARTNRYHADSD